MQSQMLQCFSNINIASSQTIIKQARLTSLNAIITYKLSGQWCDECELGIVALYGTQCPYCQRTVQTISSAAAHLLVYESDAEDLYFTIRGEETQNFKFINEMEQYQKQQNYQHDIDQVKYEFQSDVTTKSDQYLILQENKIIDDNIDRNEKTKAQEALLQLPCFIGSLSNHAKLNQDIIIGRTTYFQVAKFTIDNAQNPILEKAQNNDEQTADGTEMQKSFADYFSMYLQQKQKRSDDTTRNVYLVKNSQLPLFVVQSKTPMIKNIYVNNTILYINQQIIQLTPLSINSGHNMEQRLKNISDHPTYLQQQMRQQQFIIQQSKTLVEINKQSRNLQYVLEAANSLLTLFEDNFIGSLIKTSFQTINMTKNLQRYVIRMLAGIRYGDTAIFISQQPQFYRFVTQKIVTVIQSIQMHICLQKTLRTSILRFRNTKKQILEINDINNEKTNFQIKSKNIQKQWSDFINNQDPIHVPLQSGSHWNEYDFIWNKFQNFSIKSMISNSKNSKNLYKISNTNQQQDNILIKINVEQGRTVTIAPRVSDITNLSTDSIKSVQVNGLIHYIAFNELVYYHFTSKQLADEYITFLPCNAIFEQQLIYDAAISSRFVNSTINITNVNTQIPQQSNQKTKLNQISYEDDKESTEELSNVNEDRKQKVDENESRKWVENTSILINQLFIQESIYLDCNLILEKCQFLFRDRQECNKTLFKSILHLFTQMFKDQANDIILAMTIIIYADIQKLNTDVGELIKMALS